MKHFFIFLFLSWHISYAQNIPSKKYLFSCSYGENNRGIELCEYFQSNFKTNKHAEEAVNKILKIVGQPRNFVIVSCPNIQNAIAVTTPDDGIRYIIYDNAFMEGIDLSTKSNWSSMSILAHEVGHHFSGHTLRKSKDYIDQQNKELEADRFSGFIMYKLGATLQQAQAAMRDITDDSDDTGVSHPKLSRRLVAIEEGFNDAKAQTTVVQVDKTPNVESIYNEGTDLAYAGKYKEAIEKLTAVLVLNPKYRVAYNQRGYCKFLLNDLDGALQDYDNGLKLGYDSYLLANRSNLKLKLNDLDGALSDCQLLVDNFSNIFSAYWQRGYVYEQMGKYDLALIDYNTSLKLNPNEKAVLVNRGNVKFIIKDYRGALDDYNTIIDKFTVDAYTYDKRGQIYYYLKQYEKSISDYDKAISLNSSDAVLYSNRSLSYTMLDQFLKASQDLDNAIKLNPQNSEYYYNRARNNFFSGNIEIAISDYDKTIQISPNDYRAFDGRGICFHILKKYDNALNDYNKAIEISPNYDNSYVNRGALNENLAKYKLALEDFNKAIAINPSNSKAYESRGNTYWKLKDKDKACDNWKTACQLGNKKGCESLGIVCNNTGRVLIQPKWELEKN